MKKLLQQSAQRKEQEIQSINNVAENTTPAPEKPVKEMVEEKSVEEKPVQEVTEKTETDPVEETAPEAPKAEKKEKEEEQKKNRSLNLKSFETHNIALLLVLEDSVSE